jgi:hypothetical protein
MARYEIGVRVLQWKVSWLPLPARPLDVVRIVNEFDTYNVACGQSIQISVAFVRANDSASHPDQNDNLWLPLFDEVTRRLLGWHI